MERKTHPVPGWVAAGFPVVMEVSHLNISMHLIFPQVTSTVLHQTCDHAVTTAVPRGRAGGSGQTRCLTLKAEDATARADPGAAAAPGTSAIGDEEQSPASRSGL